MKAPFTYFGGKSRVAEVVWERFGAGVRHYIEPFFHLGGGNAGDGEQGLYAWMEALSARLRRVRVCCGDWARVVTDGAMTIGAGGVTAVFLATSAP